MFEGWDSYYLIVGGVAGALIGLMFVVATLMAGFEAGTIARGAPIYFTPIVFHFTIVVVISAVAEVPELPPAAVAVLLGLIAGLGLVYSALTARRILIADWETKPHWSDKWYYGFIPSLAYLGLGAAAAAAWRAPQAASYLVAAAALAVLLTAIRDAWDLAIAIVARAHQRPG